MLMDNNAPIVDKLLHQQAAIAEFGSFALRQDDLLRVLTEAARVCATGLGVPFSKICRYRTVEDDLLIEAGYGWNAGVVGHVVSRADKSSPQGRAFVTGEPSICNDLRQDHFFALPGFYADHGIVSTIDVIIKGSDVLPYGVLEIDNDQQHQYDQHDVNFLTSFANVLAEAVATAARTSVLQATILQMKNLVEEKDRLLDQKKVLAQELQHRVRNNLQLIYGMLSKQQDDTQDAAGLQGLKAIARRVSTLAQVYDNLLGTEIARTSDFGSYARSLCLNLAEIQDMPAGTVTLSCDSEALILDLDTVTALGIVIAELVANSYDHAFAKGTGSISVAVRHAPGSDIATLTVSDDGDGFNENADSKRHGIGLVRRLVEQLRGAAALDTAHGTRWTITFPITSASVAHSNALSP
jgi:two-component sensor histidine kinase